MCPLIGRPNGHEIDLTKLNGHILIITFFRSATRGLTSVPHSPPHRFPNRLKQAGTSDELLPLTARVFKAVDGVGQEADAAQEAGPLLLVNLLVIPHADCDRVRFPDVSEEQETRKERGVNVRLRLSRRCHEILLGVRVRVCEQARINRTRALALTENVRFIRSEKAVRR